MATIQGPSCSACQDLVPPHLVLTVSSLVEGVLRGCQWCLVLERAVEWHQPVDQLSSIIVIREGSLSLYVTPKDKSKGGFVIELYSDSSKCIHFSAGIKINDQA